MHIILSGYIKSAQLKHTPDKRAVCSMVLAFNQRQDQGSVVRHIELTAWNQLAVDADKTYATGGYAIVEASFRNDVLERTDGSKDHLYSLVVNQIHSGYKGLNLNYANLVGNAGADSDYILFESGAYKATNRMAVRRNSESTDWISVEGWGKTADMMRDHLIQGKQVYINGQLKIDCWKDKVIWQERSRPLVVISNFTLLDGDNRSAGSNGRSVPNSAPQSVAAAVSIGATNYDHFTLADAQF